MDYAAQFPVLDQFTYLNTANSGILSKSLAIWRKTHDESFMALGSNFRLEPAVLLNELRANLSRVFGSDEEHVFLVPNFSFGFNTFLNGLNQNHRFLLLANDYPSVNQPVVSRKFETFEIPIKEDLEARIEEAIRKFKPSVFAFSLVQYISGMRMDPEFIKKIKETYPDLLLVADGTQFCGTSAFNFKASGLDVLISSGYKWLLAGYGNGFVFLSDQAKGILYQKQHNVPLPKAPFLLGKSMLSLCFEPGHLDTLSFGTLNQSLLYLESIGFENIERMNQSISQSARTALYNKGLLDEGMFNRKVQSTIISLSLSAETVTKLAAAKIICSARGAGTRFSFHFYNTEDELQQLLRVIG